MEPLNFPKDWDNDELLKQYQDYQNFLDDMEEPPPQEEKPPGSLINRKINVIHEQTAASDFFAHRFTG